MAVWEEKGAIDYAASSSTDDSNRSGRNTLAGESLHSDAAHDQVDFERSCGDRGGFVAAEHIWISSFALEHPHRVVGEVRDPRNETAPCSPELRDEHGAAGCGNTYKFQGGPRAVR
jgi:hypothetical protein